MSKQTAYALVASLIREHLSVEQRVRELDLEMPPPLSAETKAHLEHIATQLETAAANAPIVKPAVGS